MPTAYLPLPVLILPIHPNNWMFFNMRGLISQICNSYFYLCGPHGTFFILLANICFFFFRFILASDLL